MFGVIATAGFLREGLCRCGIQVFLRHYWFMRWSNNSYMNLKASRFENLNVVAAGLPT